MTNVTRNTHFDKSSVTFSSDTDRIVIKYSDYITKLRTSWFYGPTGIRNFRKYLNSLVILIKDANDIITIRKIVKIILIDSELAEIPSSDWLDNLNEEYKRLYHLGL